MSNLSIVGKLHAKFPTQQIKDNFSKREFVLEITEETQSGMVFTNFAAFQLINASCAVIDNMLEGENLRVTFNIRGNRWERDGQVKYITNLTAWRVERADGSSSQSQPQSASNTQAYQQPSNTAQPPAASDANDDLPF